MFSWPQMCRDLQATAAVVKGNVSLQSGLGVVILVVLVLCVAQQMEELQVMEPYSTVPG